MDSYDYDNVESGSILDTMRTITSEEKHLADLLNKEVQYLRKTVGNTCNSEDSMAQMGVNIKNILKSAQKARAGRRLQLENLVTNLSDMFEQEE